MEHRWLFAHRQWRHLILSIQKSQTLTIPMQWKAAQDFHDLLKARAMQVPSIKPIQIVLPMTYSENARRKQKRKKNVVRELQDPATRAWNFHTAIYYKAGGSPWRLIRDEADLTCCFVGISFYKGI